MLSGHPPAGNYHCFCRVWQHRAEVQSSAQGDDAAAQPGVSVDTGGVTILPTVSATYM